jgi:predicted dehydrogenase/threonine dehydrogenase-like Zn-dependent dehydrogenase
MKQVLQDLKSGSVIVAETPDPPPTHGRLLVRVQASLLSAGTESAQVAKARQSLLTKIREKPQLLRKALEELRERGVAGLQEKLASKYEGYAELGYSCAGQVVHGGDGPGSPAPGTLVACGGVGLANHAEFVSVPPLLAAVAPDGVSPEAAAFTTVGAIAMQGVRQSGAQLGEYVAVIGLGLVGLLTVQLLRAAGCRVAGVDPSEKARQRGLSLGCEAVAAPEQAGEAVLGLSGGLGADAVIICAATSASAPVELAGKLARSRGRVVMVGATGMTIPREDYYLKELSFTLSRSYGPGRYDRRYEEEGQDYPVDYVRFTEQRNMRAFLELVQKAEVDAARLITHRFPVEQAPAAYALLNDPSVDRAGVLLTYPAAALAPARFAIQVSPSRPAAGGAVGVGFVGAGVYAQSMILPLLKKRTDVVLRSVMTLAGSQALHVSRRFGFEKVCTQAEEVLKDPAVQLVFVCTRHDSHAALACQALRAGKNVWVEKPLSLSVEELREVWRALGEHPASRLVVGFNRSFSPSATWLLNQFGALFPRMMLFRVNAGAVPPDSWVHDPKVGGGRLLGEGCHFFDFLRHAAGAAAESVMTETSATGQSTLPATDNFAATVRFRNASVGQVLYSSQGAARMGKEYFECFAGQKSGALHDFRDADFFERERQTRLGRRQQDKGQGVLLEAFISSVREGKPSPMRPEDILESMLLTLAAQQSLVSRQPVQVADLRKLIL